jgi:phosphoserine aminotransferase
MGKGAAQGQLLDGNGPARLRSDGSLHCVKRSFNFCAGPAMLDSEAMFSMWSQFCSWQGSGVSLIEMSQRDKDGPVQTMISEAVRNIRKLLSVPSNYKILLFQVLNGSLSSMRSCPLL